MKIAAFSVRPDEKQYFDTFANVYKVELQINRSGFTAGDIESVKGCEAMSVCNTDSKALCCLKVNTVISDCPETDILNTFCCKLFKNRC